MILAAIGVVFTAPSAWRTLRRWLIARAIRRIIVAFRIGRSTGLDCGRLEGGGDFEVIGFEPEAEAPAPAPLAIQAQPGRQTIAMPAEIVASTMFGTAVTRPWRPPVPDHAHVAMWEDCHRFAQGAKPKRDPYFGLMNHEPALALICPGCDLEQTPLTSGERRCGYCGLNLKLIGSRLFWWRDRVEVAEWRPK